MDKLKKPLLPRQLWLTDRHLGFMSQTTSLVIPVLDKQDIKRSLTYAPVDAKEEELIAPRHALVFNGKTAH